MHHLFAQLVSDERVNDKTSGRRGFFDHAPNVVVRANGRPEPEIDFYIFELCQRGLERLLGSSAGAI
jgi:hypothetical protein